MSGTTRRLETSLDRRGRAAAAVPRRRASLVALAATLALACASASSAPRAPEAPPAPSVTVMTRNLYHGGEFDGIRSAPPTAVPLAVDAMWETLRASNPPARMRALAAEIAAARPDLVALQEAALWRTQSPGDGPRTPAARIEYDLLELLLAELRARGVGYRPAATFTGVDVELTGASGDDYRLTDRDVVLAADGIALSSPREGVYRALYRAPVPVPGGGVAPGVRRGWASVDVAVGGRTFRFVATHLDTDPALAAAQARELADAAGAGTVVLAGDFNAGPGEPAYAVLVDGAGLRDAWSETGRPAAATCCRERLGDPAAPLSRRVDLVLVRGGIAARSASVVGADRGSMVDGLWPSDHAGVVARLSLP